MGYSITALELCGGREAVAGCMRRALWDSLLSNWFAHREAPGLEDSSPEAVEKMSEGHLGKVLEKYLGHVLDEAFRHELSSDGSRERILKILSPSSDVADFIGLSRTPLLGLMAMLGTAVEPAVGYEPSRFDSRKFEIYKREHGLSKPPTDGRPDGTGLMVCMEAIEQLLGSGDTQQFVAADAAVE